MTRKFLKIATGMAFFAFSSVFPTIVRGDGEAGESATVEGELTVIIAEDFANGRVEHFYSVKDAVSGEVYDIRFDSDQMKRRPPPRMRTGSRVRVKGRKRGREIVAAANGESVETLQVASAVVSGEQRTLVLLINFQDAPLECSASSVQSLMFSPTQQSVDGLYQEMSNGNVWFTGDVYGPFTVPYNSSGACDYSGWASSADAAAQTAGVNLGQYNHKVYVFPSNNGCGWAGLGTIGGSPSRAWIAYCDLADVFAHELGHNLTMHHASTDSNNDGTSDCEYCDTSDIMGYGGVGWRQIDGPHKEQMGWLPTNKVVTVSSSATFYIAPTELAPGSTPYPQLLKMARPATSDYYYFSYRRKVGYDAALQTQYADKSNIHHYKGSGATQTYLIKSLSDGGSFQDSTTGVTITQLAHNDNYATLFVSFGCSPVVPVVSVNPSSQSALPGAILNYSVTVSNADSTACAVSTFQLNPSSPSGWPALVTPSSFTLSPGQTGSATLTVSVPSTVLSGNYNVGVSVSDNFSASHSASATAVAAIQTPLSSRPTPPPGLTVRSSGKRVYLAWGASTDDKKVIGYSVWRDGVRIANITGRRYTDSRVMAGTSYSYYVTARDADGNISDPSDTVTIMALAGRLAPAQVRTWYQSLRFRQ